MKTVKTANGVVKIDDWDQNYVPVKLRDILHDHRETLISNILKGNGLETYVSYKFNVKAYPEQLANIREQLFELMHSPLELDNYMSILEDVLKNENIRINNEVFFVEIEAVIKRGLMEEENYTPGKTFKFSNLTLLANIRKLMVEEIQTEAGLRKYIRETYSAGVLDKSKFAYLMDEVREHFKKEPSDYTWLREMHRELNMADLTTTNEYIFDKEMEKLLKGHFVS